MSTVTAEARHRFASLTPDQVFAAWTDPALLRQWMVVHLRETEPEAQVTRIQVDAVVGGRYCFADSRDGSEAWGYYKELERPHRIAFSWFVDPAEEQEDNSLVTLRIEPEGAGSIVYASHEMSDEWTDYLEQTGRAWASMLEAIDQALSPR
ncbi:MAG: SRPBCC domain-containing protein [Devosia sp.]|uniref:SRPBCC family protein n=1 Tax=Devosia sp. TaxID=1871048 RepID=UPI0024C50FC3|nr:SRPBCC family protein [Devosia sp.]UYO01086.1 MAG: SRPBCC domain-containing protein [Devosia sp.]